MTTSETVRRIRFYLSRSDLRVTLTHRVGNELRTFDGYVSLGSDLQTVNARKFRGRNRFQLCDLFDVIDIRPTSELPAQTAHETNPREQESNMNNETKALSTWAQRSVFVDHREWVGGASTHFSARVYVDGVEVARIPFTYGYGDYFKHCAMQALVTLGIVTGATDHSALWHLRDACGIDVYTATRTASQRDVKAFGAASGSSVHHINIATGCAFAEVRA